ncbi:MAG: signal peptidase II, partial [Micrococcales bacterium]|nr:signal peptidase II [Micrococcales bacterium]
MSTDPTGEAGRPHRRRYYWLLAALAAAAYASDQLTKALALHALADGQPRPFIDDVIQLRLIGNP